MSRRVLLELAHPAAGRICRMALRVSFLWRKACSRAGLPCCTIRGTGHESFLLPGMSARVGRWVCSQGCPGPSFRAGSLHPRGCVLGQGLCRLPGSALSLPRELPTMLQGEAAVGRCDSWQGRVLLQWRGCCMGQSCSQLAITPGHLQRVLLKKDIEAAFT